MCDERERLIDYVYDECDPQEREHVNRHLEECDTCRVEVRGLRQVREDLLAWEVPRHESVWTPFAPAKTAPWWREVPAWAMAAAATLTFTVGAAGGVLTTAVASAAATEAPPQVAVVERPALTPADVAALQQRIVMLQADLAEQRARTESVSKTLDAVGQSSAETIEELLVLLSAMNSTAKKNSERLSRLQSDIMSVAASVADPGRR
jgi:anti-sigma factor RsiW